MATHDIAALIVHRLMTGPSTPLQDLPPEEHEQAAELLRNVVQEILDAHGPSAFESPRPAAIAHEVGHAIVSAHDDVRVEKIVISKIPSVGEHAWHGVTTQKGHPLLIDPDTPVIEALSHACFIIAGEVGEAVLVPDDHRAGTALDEVLFSQRIASAMAGRVKMEPSDLWEEIRKRSWHIIAHNEAVARELMAKLDRTESLQRRALTDVLDRVRKIADDWRWIPGTLIGGNDGR